jgi:hypothetical protein
MPEGAAFRWPDWPASMREETAAAYLDISPSTFRARVAPAVPGFWLTEGCRAWLREDLDAYRLRRAGRIVVDQAPGVEQPSPPEDSQDDPIAAGLAALASSKGRARRPRQAR